ncbi:MAG: glutathione S-transferase family protein [Piscinibacter sp.]|uniref:glutathione S-transferase family protein n=1 Tax=Piscinibacter sp. TaxID=1903157 RepID=UPI003D14C78F
MHPFILHHYANSPFSEKVRLIFGAKGMAWHSVHVPSVMPKPDVVALTGGYRRTPILQRGADVWCDTALIARVLDRAQPEPPLYPPGVAGASKLLAQWADGTLFWAVIPYTLQPQGLTHVMAGVPPEGLKAFVADRAPFTAGMVRQTPADATVALGHYLAWLEEQLADGRAYLCGSVPSIADFSVGHCVWFVHLAPPMTAILDPHPRLRAWYARMISFGHGTPTTMTSTDALALAAATTSHEPCRVEPGLGFDAGEAVTVTPIDYGRDPVAGTLVGLDADEVVIRRHDERAGTLHVHFPRIGFQIRKDSRT